jgi:hypothetical protein
MSWSLGLSNGDLSLSGARLSAISGAEKLVQDLRCALLEPRGNDDMHPRFGSTIDGGLDDSGNDVPSVIGVSDVNYVALRIQAEIQRIAGEYQQQQLARAENDRYVYGESTLNNGELLLSIASIKFFQIQDTLVVEVHIQTGSGSTIPITVPLATT